MHMYTLSKASYILVKVTLKSSTRDESHNNQDSSNMYLTHLYEVKHITSFSQRMDARGTRRGDEVSQI